VGLRLDDDSFLKARRYAVSTSESEFVALRALGKAANASALMIMVSMAAGTV